jgi:hypothetical protein
VGKVCVYVCLYACMHAQCKVHFAFGLPEKDSFSTTKPDLFATWSQFHVHIKIFHIFPFKFMLLLKCKLSCHSASLNFTPQKVLQRTAGIAPHIVSTRRWVVSTWAGNLTPPSHQDFHWPGSGVGPGASLHMFHSRTFPSHARYLKMIFSVVQPIVQSLYWMSYPSSVLSVQIHELSVLLLSPLSYHSCNNTFARRNLTDNSNDDLNP